MIKFHQLAVLGIFFGFSTMAQAAIIEVTPDNFKGVDQKVTELSPNCLDQTKPYFYEITVETSEGFFVYDFCSDTSDWASYIYDDLIQIILPASWSRCTLKETKYPDGRVETIYGGQYKIYRLYLATDSNNRVIKKKLPIAYSRCLGKDEEN